MLNHNLALCLAGSGIYDLSVRASEEGRESHSILGSLFLNPTVAAGVAFGSGGTQMRKGPAYTDRALWCKVTRSGEVEVVNSLGPEITSVESCETDHEVESLNGAESLTQMLERVENGQLTDEELINCKLPASDAERYRHDICLLNEHVSRCNADTHGQDVNRSEGKVMILATLHETFAPPNSSRTFWVSCDSLDAAQSFKQQVLMQKASDLPISCEYMDRDSFDVVDRAGRALCAAISVLGMGSKLTASWNFKLWFEGLPLPWAETIPDKLLYWVNRVVPSPLPKAVRRLAEAKDHHMLLQVGEFGDGELDRFERRLEQHLQQKSADGVVVHLCTPKEVAGINYFRFAAAPAFRTWCVGNGLQGISIDYALPKNYTACPSLSVLGSNQPITRMRYSHFGCNVVHEDLAFEAGVDVEACKMQIKRVVEELGGKLPAEHGHGTEYVAPKESQMRWQEMDPTNVMNPGVGGTSYTRNYK